MEWSINISGGTYQKQTIVRGCAKDPVQKFECSCSRPPGDVFCFFFQIFCDFQKLCLIKFSGSVREETLCVRWARKSMLIFQMRSIDDIVFHDRNFNAYDPPTSPMDCPPPKGQKSRAKGQKSRGMASLLSPPDVPFEQNVMLHHFNVLLIYTGQYQRTPGLYNDPSALIYRLWVHPPSHWIPIYNTFYLVWPPSFSSDIMNGYGLLIKST